MSPSPALARRKAPDLVRQALLDATARVIRQEGLAALTVQDVADVAGVSKGALFHHFSSKQAPLDATLGAMLDDFEQDLRAHMQQAPASHGCFTRAYVEVTFDHLLQQTRDSDIGLT
ncbi:MAG TPA: TetR family transcriptional regulator, partial [Stenotrophomonas sp.]|nr:TetR family transcriptional regulator [Stenotrophomonas sp.]